MILLQSSSLRFIAILSICFNFGFLEKTLANNKYCKGASCNNQNPVEYRCNSDARVASEFTKTVYRWQDSWQPKQIIVQKMYSEKCHATWSRGYVPDDTYFYMKERDLVNGNQATHKLSKADGKGYFWADGNMSNGDIVNQACVAIPSVVMPRAGYLYDRYCTDSN